MTRQSIGSDTPEEKVDADRDGAPDRAERDFEAVGRVQPTGSDAKPVRPHQDRDRAPDTEAREGDDGGMESTRENGRGTVKPPDAN